MPSKPDRAAPQRKKAPKVRWTTPQAAATPKRSKQTRKQASAPVDLAVFRKKAESRLYQELADVPELSTEVIQKLVHELGKHQVELETQNEELRVAQVKLEESARKWRTTFDAIGDAICLLDPDQKVIQCNKAMSDLIGKPYEELIGRRCWELVHGIKAPIEGCPIARMRRTRRKETMSLSADGQQLEVAVHPVLAEDGSIVAAVHVIANVTERKLAEEQIRDQLGKLHALYTATRKLSGSLDLQRLAENAVSVCVQNFNLRLAWLGRAEPDGSFSTLAHFPLSIKFPTRTKVRWDESPERHGPAGRAVHSGFPIVIGDIAQEPMLLPWHEAALNEGLSTCVTFPLAGRSQTFGTLTLFADEPGFFSSERMEFLQTYVHQIAAALENARLYEAVKVELAERKWAEEALRGRMNDLAILHEASQRYLEVGDEQETFDGLCTITARGLGLRMAWVGLVREGDFDVHPVASHGFEDGYLSRIRVTWDDSPTGRGPTGKAIRTRKAVSTNRIETDPGYEPWRAEATARGYRSAASVPLICEDTVLGTLTVYSAEPEHFTPQRLQLLQSLANAAAMATQRARLYEQMKRSAELLKQTVEERTAELAGINAELESFAYSVSHDLRAPLRALQGISAALLADYGPRLDEVGWDYARRIAAAAERMDVLIADLLAYSRLTRAQIKLKPVSLSAVVADALATLQGQVDERRAELKISEPLPKVIGHRPTLVQVVSNLVINALTFVPPEVVPKVRIWSKTRNGRVRLWIEDNGIGVAPEHHERIFHVFERLHGVETYPGTGIGLAIVQKGVTRMNGECGVESALGTGSRFWVELQAVGGRR